MPETGRPLRVYTLDGLPPEVVAVAFAKTSRVPDSFDVIARELSEADSSRFHEKWVVGYGHSSVAEHAVLSIAVENVSILGAKILEENRLSSFTEKSTRYQVMDGSNYYTPPAFSEGRLGRLYRDSAAALFSAYGEVMPRAREYSERAAAGPGAGEGAGVTPAGRACDMVRGLLPAAAKTNVGWTVNARVLRQTIVKMASHALTEMRGLAREIETVARVKTPTLLRHTEATPYLDGWEGRVAAEAGDVGAGRGEDAADGPGVRLVRHEPDGENAVLAAILFRASGVSHREARAAVDGFDTQTKRALLDASVRGIGGHEAPVREFESAGYTFEIVVDFGAYRDIQRHRMTSQTRQILGADLGYAIPDDARAAGVADRMERALVEARERCRELAAADPVHAQYAVPLAYNQRFLISMDFREAYQFVRLRSRPGGHESYRRVARAVKREIERVHPLLGALIPEDDTDGRQEA